MVFIGINGEEEFTVVVFFCQNVTKNGHQFIIIKNIVQNKLVQNKTK